MGCPPLDSLPLPEDGPDDFGGPLRPHTSSAVDQRQASLMDLGSRNVHGLLAHQRSTPVETRANKNEVPLIVSRTSPAWASG